MRPVVGWRVVLATDDRAHSLSDSFPAERRIPLPAATFRPGDPAGMFRAGATILRGVTQARAELASLKPAIVVGFGGEHLGRRQRRSRHPLPGGGQGHATDDVLQPGPVLRRRDSCGCRSPMR